jgi:predicted TIM-barrel fold metal-dependent hydrolase
MFHCRTLPSPGGHPVGGQAELATPGGGRAGAAGRALPALLNLVSPDRLLHGSDYPFTSAPVATALAVKLAATDTLDFTEKRQVFSGDAAQLFPRLTGTKKD